jgi:hypothetical protein
LSVGVKMCGANAEIDALCGGQARTETHGEQDR